MDAQKLAQLNKKRDGLSSVMPWKALQKMTAIPNYSSYVQKCSVLVDCSPLHVMFSQPVKYGRRLRDVSATREWSRVGTRKHRRGH